MRVLVTGGLGYIGWLCCEKLKDLGAEVIPYDNSPAAADLKELPGDFVFGDILDTDHLVRTIKKFQIDSIIHLAAKSNVRESHNKSIVYLSNNVFGTSSVISAAKLTRIKKVIFTSSCSVYGEGWVNESTPRNPLSVYGMTKGWGEDLLMSCDAFQSVILRLFNVAGTYKGLKNCASESYNGRIIPRLVDSALNGTKVCIFGSKHLSGNEVALRDYVHVTDVVDAILKSLVVFRADTSNQIFNVCSGKGTSIDELIGIVELFTGNKVHIEYMDPLRFEANKIVSSPSKIIDALKWRPENSSLNSIVESVVTFGGASFNRDSTKLSILTQ